MAMAGESNDPINEGRDFCSIDGRKRHDPHVIPPGVFMPFPGFHPVSEAYDPQFNRIVWSMDQILLMPRYRSALVQPTPSAPMQLPL
jgi:hypothetical protein